MGSFLPSLGIGNGRNLEGCFLCSVHFFFFFFMNVIVAGRREREGVICVGPYMD